MATLWIQLRLIFLVLIINIPLTVGAMGLQTRNVDGPPSYTELMTLPREPGRAVITAPTAVPMDNVLVNAWMKEQTARVRKTTCSDALTRTACLHNCWLNIHNKPLEDDGVVPPNLQQNDTVKTMAARIRAVGCCKMSCQTFLICCCCSACCQRPPDADNSESVLKATISRLNCCNICCNTANHCLCTQDGCCAKCCNGCGECCHDCCAKCGKCCNNCCECCGDYCNCCCTCKRSFHASDGGEYGTFWGCLNDCCYHCWRCNC